MASLNQPLCSIHHHHNSHCHCHMTWLSHDSHMSPHVMIWAHYNLRQWINLESLPNFKFVFEMDYIKYIKCQVDDNMIRDRFFHRTLIFSKKPINSHQMPPVTTLQQYAVQLRIHYTGWPSIGECHIKWNVSIGVSHKVICYSLKFIILENNQSEVECIEWYTVNVISRSSVWKYTGVDHQKSGWKTMVSSLYCSVECNNCTRVVGNQ